MDPNVTELNFNNWYSICKSNLDDLFYNLLEYCENNDSEMIKKDNYSDFVRFCYKYSPRNRNYYNNI